MPFELAEKLLDRVPRHNHHDHGLQIAFGVRQQMDGPDNLRDRHGREFLQLQLHHREGFIEIARRELGHAQEDLFGREPGNVELALP